MREEIERFLLNLEVQRNYSAHTVRAYRGDLEAFVAFYEEKKLPFPEGMDRFLVRDYLSFLNEQGVARNSLLRKISSVRSFAEWLLSHRMISQDPFDLVMLPKKDRKLPRFLTEGEVGKLQDANAPDLVEERDEEYRFPERDFAIFELLYSSGLRRSEIAGLNIGDVDFYSGMVRVFGKGRKERLVPAGDRALQCIKDYLATRPLPHGAGEPLFLNCHNTRMSGNGIALVLQKMARRARFVRRVNPHSLRHSFATHLLDNGCDLKSVQEMLGHKNLQTTEIYTHVSLEKLKEVYERAHPGAAGDEEDKPV